MKTKIEKIEGKADAMLPNLHHIEALMKGLDNRPQDFIFRGEVFESKGYCVCGHPIRWSFVVHDSKEKVGSRNLGSTCIENYSLYNPENAQKMRERWAEIQEQIKKSKAQAKKIKEGIIIKDVSERWEQKRKAVVNYYFSFRNNNKMAPYAIWSFVNRENYYNLRADKVIIGYKRVKGAVKKLEADIKRMEYLLTLEN